MSSYAAFSAWYALEVWSLENREDELVRVSSYWEVLAAENLLSFNLFSTLPVESDLSDPTTSTPTNSRSPNEVGNHESISQIHESISQISTDPIPLPVHHPIADENKDLVYQIAPKFLKKRNRLSNSTQNLPPMEIVDAKHQPKLTANQLPNFRLPFSTKNTKQPLQGKMNLLRAQDRCVQGNMNLRRAQDRCQLRMPYAAATLGTSSLRTTDFLFDSGSSTHLVGGGIALYDAELAIDYNVQLAAGTAPVHSIGYLDILIPSRPCKVTLTLSNVIRVPSASLNLISVSKVATMPGVDVSINFYATRARIVIGGNAIDILLHNGTYIASTTILRPIHLSTAAASHDLLQEESSVTTHASIEEELDALVFPNEPRLEIPTPMLPPTTSTSLSPPTSLSPDVITVLDLHSFYNHKNLRELQRLTRAGLLPDLPEELRINLLRTRKLSCPACTLGKSTLSSGSKVPSSTPSLPGQRAHSDYAGPFITSHRGDRFAQAFTDSSSGFTFLEFHPDRTSARALFGLQLYRIWVKTHSTHALHTVTTDGGELTVANVDYSAEGLVSISRSPLPTNQAKTVAQNAYGALLSL